MSEPTIAERRPCVLDLEPGIYWWCACGKSKEQPWCDGSHKGSEFSPVAIEVNEPERMALCQCKHSANGHRCDGTHKNLP
jgi:CDGSH-type Zn-finger protein